MKLASRVQLPVSEVKNVILEYERVLIESIKSEKEEFVHPGLFKITMRPRKATKERMVFSHLAQKEVTRKGKPARKVPYVTPIGSLKSMEYELK